MGDRTISVSLLSPSKDSSLADCIVYVIRVGLGLGCNTVSKNCTGVHCTIRLETLMLFRLTVDGK